MPSHVDTHVHDLCDFERETRCHLFSLLLDASFPSRGQRGTDVVVAHLLPFAPRSRAQLNRRYITIKKKRRTKWICVYITCSRRKKEETTSFVCITRIVFLIDQRRSAPSPSANHYQRTGRNPKNLIASYVSARLMLGFLIRFNSGNEKNRWRSCESVRVRADVVTPYGMQTSVSHCRVTNANEPSRWVDDGLRRSFASDRTSENLHEGLIIE